MSEKEKCRPIVYNERPWVPIVIAPSMIFGTLVLLTAPDWIAWSPRILLSIGLVVAAISMLIFDQTVRSLSKPPSEFAVAIIKLLEEDPNGWVFYGSSYWENLKHQESKIHVQYGWDYMMIWLQNEHSIIPSRVDQQHIRKAIKALSQLAEENKKKDIVSTIHHCLEV